MNILKVLSDPITGKSSNPIWPPIWPTRGKICNIFGTKGDRHVILVSKHMFLGVRNTMECISSP